MILQSQKNQADAIVAKLRRALLQKDIPIRWRGNAKVDTINFQNRSDFSSINLVNHATSVVVGEQLLLARAGESKVDVILVNFESNAFLVEI